MHIPFREIISAIGPIVFLVMFIVSLYLFERDVQKLKTKHKEELSKVRQSLPVVQHCNSRTNYEFIKHQYDPERCKHCKEVQELLNER